MSFVSYPPKQQNKTEIFEPAKDMFIFHNEVEGKHKMHIHPLDLESDWIRIDETYEAQMALKHDILENRRSQVFKSLSERNKTIPAVGGFNTLECEKELLRIIGEYLPRRYPIMFHLENNTILNKITGESVSLDPDDSENPLLRASRLTQEDWCILEWDKTAPESEPVLTSGVVCFPSGWSMEGKFMQCFSSIHQPVDPLFKLHFQKRASNLISNLKPEKPLWRANWGIFNNLRDPLDLCTPEERPSRKTPFTGKETGKNLMYRAEYQTLRRLPATKCVVFSIRTYQMYLEDIPHGADRIALLKAVQTMDPLMDAYKSSWAWKPAAVEFLVRYRHRNSSTVTAWVWVGVGIVVALLAIRISVHMDHLKLVGFPVWFAT